MAAKKKQTEPTIYPFTISLRLTPDEYWGLMVAIAENKTTVAALIREGLRDKLNYWASIPVRRKAATEKVKAAHAERDLERAYRKEAKQRNKFREQTAEQVESRSYKSDWD